MDKFIKSIIGLDVNSAKSAFSEFLSNNSYTAQQVHFINKIIDYLSVNGLIENKILFEAPFTHVNDQDLTGVFPDGQVGKVISLIGEINSNVTAK